jgi:flagellar hook assembly protein FlgD
MEMASAQQMFAVMTGNSENILEEQTIKAYPNPFHDKLTFAFSLRDDQKMDIFIYDVNGKIVKSFDNKMFYQGFNELTWDGRNEAGTTVVPGFYFVKIISDSRVDFYRLIKAQ